MSVQVIQRLADPAWHGLSLSLCLKAANSLRRIFFSWGWERPKVTHGNLQHLLRPRFQVAHLVLLAKASHRAKCKAKGRETDCTP